MSSYNRATIVGRLGRDPELKYTGAGKAVCSFSVATDEGRGDQKRTEWHRVVAWEKTAELVGQYLRKGSLCLVEGRLQTREWEKDGIKRQQTEIVAGSVQFLESKRDQQQSQDRGGHTGGGSDYGAYGDGSSTQPNDDVPF